ncbi:MAG TPA: septal ring lytic transglycosylase RlpA family protein [Cytophagaceae bacterium]|jgi:rare lipoprotein A|nr:septal ring lytic transglycosylase RlpA family protein [Cytophagaceae bacterium]
MFIPKSFIFILIVSFFWLSSCSKYITETGRASFYGKGDGYDGRKTADGETFNTNSYTAAHKTLPFNTEVEVKNVKTGKTVKVRINDRGPYAKGRIIDLSYAAAKQLGIIQDGVGEVQLKYKRKHH